MDKVKVKINPGYRVFITEKVFNDGKMESRGGRIYTEDDGDIVIHACDVSKRGAMTVVGDVKKPGPKSKAKPD